jgi:hypothetical protein
VLQAGTNIFHWPHDQVFEVELLSEFEGSYAPFQVSPTANYIVCAMTSTSFGLTSSVGLGQLQVLI